jgi:hypothetical protein
VQGKGFVIALRAHPPHVRLAQLEPHVDRQKSGEEQQRHRGQDIARGDALVVHRGQKAPQARRVAPRIKQFPVPGVGIISL